jgi:3-deoxy-manno-octulosonate cytidylyltransferase (CMP-KDO synthetase)
MITVVIPARMGSSRYPGKPLVPILGLPMIEHVRRRSLMADGVGLVVVATCDHAIKELVGLNGGLAVMTKDTHERCTERVQEAMESLPGDIVVMVQGDEPLLNPDAINQVALPLLNDLSLDVVNLLSPLESSDDLANPNIVKAVCDINQNVIYLTRSSVPHFRKTVKAPVFRQTGIMAFRSSFLTIFSSLSETPLEAAESIDMLRLLEHGVRIQGVLVDYVTIGVDRPADVQIIETVLHSDEFQKSLNNKINF